MHHLACTRNLLSIYERMIKSSDLPRPARIPRREVLKAAPQQNPSGSSSVSLDTTNSFSPIRHDSTAMYDRAATINNMLLASRTKTSLQEYKKIWHCEMVMTKPDCLQSLGKTNEFICLPSRKYRINIDMGEGLKWEPYTSWAGQEPYLLLIWFSTMQFLIIFPEISTPYFQRTR